MKDKNFIERVSFFITINLFLFALIMLFAPAYPWWIIFILAIVSHFGTEKLLNKLLNKGQKNRNRLNF